MHWQSILKSWLLRGLALVVLAWMSYGLLFSNHGYAVYRHEQANQQALESQLKALQQQRELLAQSILRLRHDPQALEDLVHRELGYVYPDEYMLIMPPSAAKESLHHD